MSKWYRLDIVSVDITSELNVLWKRQNVLELRDFPTDHKKLMQKEESNVERSLESYFWEWRQDSTWKLMLRKVVCSDSSCSQIATYWDRLGWFRLCVWSVFNGIRDLRRENCKELHEDFIPKIWRAKYNLHNKAKTKWKKKCRWVKHTLPTFINQSKTYCVWYKEIERWHPQVRTIGYAYRRREKKIEKAAARVPRPRVEDRKGDHDQWTTLSCSPCNNLQDTQSNKIIRQHDTHLTENTKAWQYKCKMQNMTLMNKQQYGVQRFH